jgi:hypothetical protein
MIDPSVHNLDKIERKHITLLNYQHHPVLSGEVAV